MNEKWLDERIKREFLREAQETEKELQEKEEYNEKLAMLQVSQEMEADIKRRIDLIKLEENDAYAGLSEQDRMALEIGRKVIEQNKEMEQNKNHRKKRLFFSKKRYKYMATAAAMLAIVLTVSFSSETSREYLMRKVGTVFNDGMVGIDLTNVDEIDSLPKETNKDASSLEFTSLDLNVIEEKMGVRPIQVNNGGLLEYKQINFYSNNDLAIITYDYNGYIITVSISKSYKNSAQSVMVLGSESWTVKTKKDNLEFDVYKSEEKSGKTTYSASVIYKNASYLIAGIMDEDMFNELVRNVVFL